MPSDVRLLALGAVRRGEELLVEEGADPETDEPFYRLPGGGVEFGEHSRDAVVREFAEELDVGFAVSEPVGTFEQVFRYGGEPNHEVWRVYEGRIVEDWPYEEESFWFTEPDLGTEHLARWVPIDELRDDRTTFHVPAVLDALAP